MRTVEVWVVQIPIRCTRGSASTGAPPHQQLAGMHTPSELLRAQSTAGRVVWCDHQMAGAAYIPVSCRTTAVSSSRSRRSLSMTAT